MARIESHGPIVFGRNQLRAIGRKSNRVNRRRVRADARYHPAILHIPKVDRLIIAGRDDHGAVRRRLLIYSAPRVCPTPLFVLGLDRSDRTRFRHINDDIFASRDMLSEMSGCSAQRCSAISRQSAVSKIKIAVVRYAEQFSTVGSKRISIDCASSLTRSRTILPVPLS